MQGLSVATRSGAGLFDDGICARSAVSNNRSPQFQISLGRFDVFNDDFLNFRYAIGGAGLKDIPLDNGLVLGSRRNFSFGWFEFVFRNDQFRAIEDVQLIRKYIVNGINTCTDLTIYRQLLNLKL